MFVSLSSVIIPIELLECDQAHTLAQLLGEWDYWAVVDASICVLSAGRVIIPIELLEYDQAHHAAMVRAFGGLVIARDDNTAAKLVTQHKLACITLDGKISRPGSMKLPLNPHCLCHPLQQIACLRRECIAKPSTQHKLACMTLDDKIGRPGSMQMPADCFRLHVLARHMALSLHTFTSC